MRRFCLTGLLFLLTIPARADLDSNGPLGANSIGLDLDGGGEVIGQVGGGDLENRRRILTFTFMTKSYRPRSTWGRASTGRIRSTSREPSANTPPR